MGRNPLGLTVKFVKVVDRKVKTEGKELGNQKIIKCTIVLVLYATAKLQICWNLQGSNVEI